MRTLWLLLLLCNYVLVASGQSKSPVLSGNATIDSLVGELPKYANDTSKVKLLARISFFYDQYDPNEGLVYGTQALALAKKLDWKRGIAEASNSLGNNSMALGNNSAALSYYSTALEIYSGLGNSKGRAQALGNIALFYYGISDYPKALEYWLEALGVFENINDKLGIANQLGNIAMVYQEQHNFAKSISYTQRAMGMYRQMGNKDDEAMQFGNLANTYDKMGRKEDALVAYIAVLDLYEATGNTEGIARNVMNVGITYCSMRQYVKALECQFKALELYKKLNSADGIALVYSNLAEVYYKIATDTGVILAGKNVYTDRKKCLRVTMDYAQKAIDGLRSSNNLSALSFTYRIMADAQMDAGEAKQAKVSYLLYEQYRDSVFSLEKSVQIAGLDWKRELELKDKQIELDRLAVAKKRNERYFFFAVFVLLSGVAGILFRNLKLTTARELSENKLNAFQARMNPHFIFNSLNSIQSLVLHNETIPSIRYLNEFSKLMRQILDNSAKSKVLLKTELEMLQSYLALEQLRYDNFKWTIIKTEDVDDEHISIPGMIIQPFVENSIVHGFQPDRKDWELRITFERNKQQVICTVDDNGIGRVKSAALKRVRDNERQSHGINIATSRLALLDNKKRGLVNRVVYTDKMENGIATGTLVTIQIPIL